MKSLVTNLVVIAAWFASSDAALCVPGIPHNISLTFNYTLTWIPALNPNNCNITGFFVNILDGETGSNMQLFTSHYQIDVSFIDSCKFYGFEVHAYTTQLILGPADRIWMTTPLPQDINLNIARVLPTIQNRSIEVSWNLANSKYDRCVSYYQVSYWNASSSGNVTTSLVNRQQYQLSGVLSACLNYSVEVRAIVTNPYKLGPVTGAYDVMFTQVPALPTLLSIVTYDVQAFMVWRVESYIDNPCELLYLNVETTGVPSNQTSLQFPIVQISNQNGTYRLDTTIRIQGLQPNNVYVSEVSVVGVGGRSKNVEVTFLATSSVGFNSLLNVR